MEQVIRIDKYTLLSLEDKGKYGYSLIEGWEGRDGSFKPSFCKREVGKEKVEKIIPVSIRLGPKDTAVAACVMILKELTGMEYTQVPF